MNNNPLILIDQYLEQQNWGQIKKGTEVLLAIDNSYLCMVTFLLCLKKDLIPILTANHQPHFIMNILKEGRYFVTDQAILKENITVMEDWVKQTPEPLLSLLPYDQIGEVEQKYLQDYVVENKKEFLEKPMFFLTSGSTGDAKFIPKIFAQLITEISLFSEFACLSSHEQYHIYSTVSHQHIYGFLYTLLLPLVIQSPIHIKKYDDLFSLYNDMDLAGHNIIITTPVQLRYFAQIEKSVSLKADMLISSGALLDDETAQVFHQHHTAVTEIYGSTETGGISYKNRSLSPDYHHLFPYVEMRIMEEDAYIRSPYLMNEVNGWYPLDDYILMDEPKKFLLKGRKDQIVKVGGKRVSVIEVKNTLLQNALVIDSHVSFDQDKQKLVAYVVLSDAGKQLLQQEKTIGLRRVLRLFLHDYLITEACPKIWYWIDEVPRNSQGKIQQSDLKEKTDKGKYALSNY